MSPMAKIKEIQFVLDLLLSIRLSRRRPKTLIGQKLHALALASPTFSCDHVELFVWSNFNDACRVLENLNSTLDDN